MCCHRLLTHPHERPSLVYSPLSGFQGIPSFSFAPPRAEEGHQKGEFEALSAVQRLSAKPMRNYGVFSKGSRGVGVPIGATSVPADWTVCTPVVCVCHSEWLSQSKPSPSQWGHVELCRVTGEVNVEVWGLIWSGCFLFCPTPLKRWRVLTFLFVPLRAPLFTSCVWVPASKLWSAVCSNLLKVP